MFRAARFALIFLGTCAASVADADLTLPSVFSDGMVLQRDTAVPIFGTADASAEVTVEFAGQTVTSDAGEDGSFRVTLAELNASSEPRTLTVRSGPDTREIRNVLVGEVWIGSGQSNMSWTVQASLSAEIESATATDPMIRLYQTPNVTAAEPQSDVDAAWVECSPETVRGFSAVLYFFGRTLRDTLGVPVGLIQTSWGGTRAEAWTPEEALRAEPELEPILAVWDERADAYDPRQAQQRFEAAQKAFAKKLAVWKKRRGEDAAAAGRPPRRPELQSEPTVDRHHYSTLYNAKVHPLVPYAMRGVVWYQGESNSGRAVQYRTLMATLIRSWREKWDTDFPFYQVQLANFQATSETPQDSAWAELREAQQMAADAVGNAGVAVITDIGAAKDIHPKDKQNVGERLARLALVDVYGRAMTRTGPTVADVTPADGTITVRFENLGEGGFRGLTTYYNEPLRGFAIRGAEGPWVWAKAILRGADTVVLSHPDVPQPTEVRYNWADNPTGTLFNKAYLPAAPFRTDEGGEVTAQNVRP